MTNSSLQGRQTTFSSQSSQNSEFAPTNSKLIAKTNRLTINYPHSTKTETNNLFFFDHIRIFGNNLKNFDSAKLKEIENKFLIGSVFGETFNLPERHSFGGEIIPTSNDRWDYRYKGVGCTVLIAYRRLEDSLQIDEDNIRAVSIEFSGKNLELIPRNQQGKVLTLIQEALSISDGLNINRIDLCSQLPTKEFNLVELENAIELGDYYPFQKSDLIINRDKNISEGYQGFTAYFGIRKSSKYARIYHAGIKHKIDAIRYEVEAKRKLPKELWKKLSEILKKTKVYDEAFHLRVAWFIKDFLFTRKTLDFISKAEVEEKRRNKKSLQTIKSIPFWQNLKDKLKPFDINYSYQKPSLSVTNSIKYGFKNIANLAVNISKCIGSKELHELIDTVIYCKENGILTNEPDTVALHKRDELDYLKKQAYPQELLTQIEKYCNYKKSIQDSYTINEIRGKISNILKVFLTTNKKRCDWLRKFTNTSKTIGQFTKQELLEVYDRLTNDLSCLLANEFN